MERKGIDQTDLIHDVLSFHTDLKISSPTITEPDHHEEHYVCNYR